MSKVYHKTAIINLCHECPNCEIPSSEEYGKGKRLHCSKLNIDVKDDFIPNECPLPEYEGDENAKQ